MKRSVFLWLCLIPTLLFGQGNVDSLYRLYESADRGKQAQYAKQLIEIFEEEEFYDHAVPEIRAVDRRFGEMLVSLGMGLYEQEASRFSNAIALGLKAESLVPKDSLQWLSSCYELLTLANFRQGEFAKAVEYAQKDYDLGERLNDDKIRSTSLNSLAGIHCHTHQYDKALEYSERSIAIERKGKDDKALAIRLGIKSEILLLMDRPQEALEAISEAIDIDSRAGRIGKVGIRLSQKSDILAHQQRWEECRNTCLQALEIFEQTDNTVDKIIVLRQLGACEIQLKQYESAEMHLREGEQLCKVTGFRPQLWRMQRQLSTLYRETGRFEKALDYLEQSASLKDSLNEERQQQIIGEYQTRFEVREKEQELNEQRDKTRNRSILAITLLCIAILTFVWAIFAYQLAKIRKKRNAELAKVNTIKDRFFSIISHDLKNPVRAQSQLLAFLSEHYEEVDDVMKKQQITALNDSAKRLGELLTSLLDWASLESGRMSCKPIRLDLSAVVRRNVELVQPLAVAKEIRVVSDLDEPCYVFTDHNCVDTILRNLLTNAVKFSLAGGSVEIVTTKGDDRVRLSVVDHGVGMSEQVKKSVFHLERISTLGTNEETGTGLGLVVCKAMTQMINGELSFISEEGKGSTFTLTLPLSEKTIKQHSKPSQE
jgi:signal transduction histidine kinase